MSAYDFNTDNITRMLMPPKLRQLKHIAWLKVLLNPLKWLHNDFYKQYCETTEDGSNTYDSLTTYNIDDRVLWTNKRGYVCLQNGTLGIDPTGTTTSSDYWLEFTPNYVAVDERVYYKPQIILFVKALNTYFRTGLFQIYVVNLAGGFVIYIPVGDYTPLGATNTERDKAIIDFSSTYLSAGIGVADVSVVSY